MARFDQQQDPLLAELDRRLATPVPGTGGIVETQGPSLERDFLLADLDRRIAMPVRPPTPARGTGLDVRRLMKVEQPFDEPGFQTWYRGHAQRLGLDPNPDNPAHFYDYRAAFKAGATPDASGHWPSTFKREGHPQQFVAGEDTRGIRPPTPARGTQLDLKKSHESAAGQFIAGTASGAAGMAESVVGLGNMLGFVPDEWLKGAQAVTRAVTPDVMSRRIMDDPAGTLANPGWWAANGGQALASIAALGGVANWTRAMTTLRYAPQAAAAVAESLTEGGSVYSEMRAAGKSPEEAAKAAALVIGANLPMLAVSNIPILEGQTKRRVINAVIGAGSESAQEMGQQVVSNVAQGKAAGEGVLEAGTVGAMVGGPVAGTRALPAPGESTGDQLRALVGEIDKRLQSFRTPPADTSKPPPGGEELLPGGKAVGPPMPPESSILKAARGRGELPPEGGRGTGPEFTPDELAAARAQAPPGAAPVSALPTPRRAPDVVPGAEGPPAAATVASIRDAKPGDVAYAAPSEIAVDPERFQFKGSSDQKGVTAAGRLAGPWNENLAGIVLAWRDPADNRVYVVNGHHRLEAAERLQAPRVLVRLVDAEDAAEARLIGALTNIAEDKGTAVDVAKVLKGSGYGADDLAKAGISPRSRLSVDGQALAKLSDPLFQRVATGELEEGLGVAIGQAGLSPEDQAAVATLIDRQAAKGRELTGGQVRALIDDVKAQPAVQKTSDQIDMFTSLLGEDRAQSVAVEKAVLRDWLMSTLAKDKRLFGYVAKGERASKLTQAGVGSIDVDAAKGQATAAAQVAAVVERLSQAQGPINVALTTAATRIAKGAPAASVRTELLTAVHAAVKSELAGPGAPPDASQPPAGRGSDQGPDSARGGPPLEPQLESDFLPTGEEQPRLPGDVGEVRDKEIVQPPIAELPPKAPPVDETEEPPAPTGPPPTFDELRAQKQRQATPKKGPSLLSQTDEGKLFEGETATPDPDVLKAMQGSPTRVLYSSQRAPVGQPGSFKDRPISEQQVVERLQDVFAIPQRASVLEKLAFGQPSRQFPVRRGHFSAGAVRAFGAYFPRAVITRLKRSMDLTTLTHELGHHIDMGIFPKVGRPFGLFRDELLKLGAATTPPSKVDTDYHVAEGVAEFFRVWFADPKLATQVAPNFKAALEAVMAQAPTFKGQLTEAQGLVQRFLGQPLEVRGRARVSVTPSGPIARAKDVLSELQANKERGSWSKRFVAALRDTKAIPTDRRAWWDQKMARWQDRHRAIWRVMRDHARELPSSLNAYTLARLADKSASAAEGMTRFGARGTDGRFMGPGLEQVLKPVQDRLYPDPEKPDQPSLVTYLIARRARELWQGKPGIPGVREPVKPRDPGMTRAEAEAIIARAKQDPDFKRIHQAAEGVYSYLEGLRDYAVQYGALGADQKGLMEEWANYVPLQRVMDEGADSFPPGSTKLADRNSPIRRLFGSGRDIIDPIESIVKNTFSLVSFVERNRAALALVDTLTARGGEGPILQEIKAPKEATKFNLKTFADEIASSLAASGWVDPAEIMAAKLTGQLEDIFDQKVILWTPTQFGRPGERILFVVDHGKQRFFQVQDEALYQNLVNLGPQTSGQLMELAGKAANVLRAGVTLRPTFALRNLVRDTLGAMFQSRHGFIPIWDNLRGFKSLFSKDEDFQRFMAFGIQQATFLGNDRKQLRAAIDKMTETRKWPSRFKPILHPVQFLQDFSSALEMATRLGEFKAALESGGVERRAGVLGIAQRAGDVFKKKAAVTEESLTKAALAAADVTVDFSRGGTAAKNWSTVAAFFNARVQGLVRTQETIARDPVGTALTSAALAGMAAVLWYWNKDDEVYQELDEQRKRDYWFLRLPGTEFYLTVPKPFVWAAIPNAVESALEEAQRNDPASLHPLRDFADAYGREFVSSVAPTLIMPTLEVLTNRDIYRGRPIVSEFKAGKEPDLQLNDWTSDTFRALGNALGVSPAKLEHWTTRTFGTAVTDVTSLITDPIAKKTLLRSRPEGPARGVEKVPGVQALITPRRIESRARSIDEFFKAYKDLEGARASMRDYMAEKGQTRVAEFRERVNQQWSAEHITRMQRAKQAIDDLFDKRSEVTASGLTPQDKRTQVDEIHRLAAAWAKWALPPTPERAAR